MSRAKMLDWQLADLREHVLELEHMEAKARAVWEKANQSSQEAK